MFLCRLFLKWYFIETKYIFLVNTKYGNFRLCSLLKYACQITSPTQNSINIKLSTIIKSEKNDSILSENESAEKFKMSLTYQI